VLIEQGYDSGIDGGRPYSLDFLSKNANHSGGAFTDDFMRAAGRMTANLVDPQYHGRPGPMRSCAPSRDLLAKVADSTWHCGDPGMQYDNHRKTAGHTCKEQRARINCFEPLQRVYVPGTIRPCKPWLR